MLYPLTVLAPRDVYMADRPNPELTDIRLVFLFFMVFQTREAEFSHAQPLPLLA